MTVQTVKKIFITLAICSDVSHKDAETNPLFIILSSVIFGMLL